MNQFYRFTQLMILFLLWSLMIPAHAATYDCANQTDIPQSECEGLVALYNSTNGDNWNNNDGWMVSTPCGWYGVACNLNSVINIHLSSNFLVGNLPSGIGNFPNLTILDLYGNELSGEIPDEIGGLTDLTYLMLNNNNLTGSIPESIGNLEMLEELLIGENQLTGPIPASIGNLTELVYLSLGYNAITGSLPSSITNLTDLQYLYLFYNQISGELPQDIGNLIKLKGLYLGWNRFSGDIPASIVNLQFTDYLGIARNMLWSYDPAVVSFLEANASGWDNQTVTPTSLQAIPVNQTTMRLRWVIPGGNSSYYEVGYGTTSGGPYTIISPAHFDQEITNLQPETTYYFVVRNVSLWEGDVTWVTPWSDEIAATTSDDPPPTWTPSPCNPCDPTETASPTDPPTQTPWPTLTPADTEIPTVFTLLEPVNGASVADPAPKFAWTTYPGAYNFRFRLRDSFDANIVNVNLSPDAICADGVCQIELESLGQTLENLEQYSWQINVNEGQFLSEEYVFNTNFAIPAVFDLLTPTDDEAVNSAAPVFSWEVSINATEYRLRVRDSFDQIAINIKITTDSTPSISEVCGDAVCMFDSAVLNVALEHNETYEWNVKAKNTVGKRKATAQEFTVLLPVPGAFNLLTPLNNDTVSTLTPILTWEESAGATEYRVRVKDDFDGTQVLKVNGLASSNCTAGICMLDTSTVTYLQSLENGESYEWKVQARNIHGKQKSNQKWVFEVSLLAQLRSQ